jgi:hypothetical protein
LKNAHKTAGERLRASVAEVLDLDGADPVWLALLDEACAAKDLVEALAAEVNGTFSVPGSKGQQVCNPLLPELRQQRLALSRMLNQLGMSDQPESEGTRQARSAARARWQGRT